MTDKIIIDGISVSECRYNYISITNDVCCYAESERAVNMEKCDRFPNCYYKQLKRKEQECEELKSTNSEQFKIIENLNNEIMWRQEALDEIDKIAKRFCLVNSNYLNVKPIQDILDIINKTKE